MEQRVGEWTLIREIGEGSPGTVVMLARHTKTGQEAACKIVAKGLNKGDAEIANEHTMMKMLGNHPRIVSLYEVHETPKSSILIMEYAPKGDLLDYVNSNQRLTEKEARRIFRQLVEALEFIHSRSVCHRDLKAENIFLDESRNVKLGDWEYGSVFDPFGKLRKSCGTLFYASPEIVKAEPYVGPEVDVWSAGVILYVMTCGCLPFWSNSPVERDRRIARKIKALKYAFPPFISAELKDLLSKIFRYADTRISLHDIINHPWLRPRDLKPLRLSKRKNRTAPAEMEHVEEDLKKALEEWSKKAKLPRSRSVFGELAVVVEG